MRKTLIQCVVVRACVLECTRVGRLYYAVTYKARNKTCLRRHIADRCTYIALHIPGAKKSG